MFALAAAGPCHAQVGGAPASPGATTPREEDPGALADRLLAKSPTPADAAIAWLEQRAGATSGGEPPEALFAKAVAGATPGAGGPNGVRVFDAKASKWTALPTGEDAKLPGHVVVFVAGFDEREAIFDTAAPALNAALGGEVRTPGEILRFDAGSDQPLRAGADMLVAALRELVKRGVRSVDLVGHSSGGLVVRDLVTRPDFYNGFPAPGEASKGAGGAGLPKIEHVVLIATPNRGSWLAPVRAGRGARDHFVRWMETKGADSSSLMAFLNEGSGEAVRDLTPGSAYLSELNSRTAPKWVKGSAKPKPDEIPLTVVVGTLTGGSALEGVDLKSVLAWPIVRQAYKADQVEMALGAAEELGRVVSDGLTPVSSAELEGAEDVVYLEANHRSLLRPWVQGETEEPPAVKALIDRLK